MQEEESKAVRGRGRPARPPEEARQAAVQAATWLLLHEGYAATTMEAVARHAGMAKKSLYQYAANREELVALVVRGWTDAFLPAMAHDAAAPGEVLPLLKEILQTMAARVLTADAVGLFRLLCTEFPARAQLLACISATVSSGARPCWQSGWLARPRAVIWRCTMGRNWPACCWPW